MEGKITPEQVKNVINKVDKPKNWRNGQFVFNRVEEIFGSVAREVQYQDKIDCFYLDNKIDQFIEKVCDRLNKNL